VTQQGLDPLLAQVWTHLDDVKQKPELTTVPSDIQLQDDFCPTGSETIPIRGRLKNIH
jgi:hypothetical protein